MRIGAYSLCYQEGSLLAANIELMYNLVDQFVVVIGQVEVSPSNPKQVDMTSESILESLDDPLKKITIITGDVFSSKDDMTLLALEFLTTDVIIQLDADEFWPRDTLIASLKKIEEGFSRVFIPHVIYFRDVKHILRTKNNLSYFSPPRVWRSRDGSVLGHFTGQWTKDGVGLDEVDCNLTLSFPIHHLGWVNSRQTLRKIQFYRSARGYKMPHAKVLLIAWPILRLLRIHFTMGPNKVRIVRNVLPSPPVAIVKVASLFRKNRLNILNALSLEEK